MRFIFYTISIKIMNTKHFELDQMAIKKKIASDIYLRLTIAILPSIYYYFSDEMLTDTYMISTGIALIVSIILMSIKNLYFSSIELTDEKTLKISASTIFLQKRVHELKRTEIEKIIFRKPKFIKTHAYLTVYIQNQQNKHYQFPMDKALQQQLRSTLPELKIP